MIECVPDSTSRDELGQTTELNLHEYFVKTYGDESTFEYQEVPSFGMCLCVRLCVYLCVCMSSHLPLTKIWLIVLSRLDVISSKVWLPTQCFVFYFK